MLARLYQAGYPVPDGFVILPAAFSGDQLRAGAWAQVSAELTRLRSADDQASFAVRSSALSEDSAQASFAGEFETVLDVHGDDMIRAAIHTVRRSRHSERVRAYSEAKGLDAGHEMAVVVQKLIRADVSGVLFTAEPVSGSRTVMLGNYVYGFGEELVSGEAEPYTFQLERPKGAYEGPRDMKRHARKLYKLALRLERDLGSPQDIEWAIAEDRLYLLQSRPITTLVAYNPVTYEWNSSHTGDYLWARQEPFPEVVTPSTWSLWQRTFLSSEVAGIPGIGNIGGRIYLNISLPYSLMMKLGRKPDEVVDLFDVLVSPLPSHAEIPAIPLSFGNLLKDLLLKAIRISLRQRKLKRGYRETVEEMPKRCRQVRAEVERAQRKDHLASLWHEHQMLPLFNDLMLLLDAMTEDYRGHYLGLKKTLTKLIGASDASTLIATMGGGSQDLTSIRPIVGLAKVVSGEMSRQSFVREHGHRHPNENELAQPRPYEDGEWVDRRIHQFEKNPVSVEELLRRRQAEFDAAWGRFAASHPAKAKSLGRRIDGYMDALHRREAVRGEITRWVGVIRSFHLRAGELLGLGNGIFFLTLDELLDSLAGDESSIPHIPARQGTHRSYAALPAYPGWIRGRFDPVKWAADPQRRGDYYDSQALVAPVADSSIIHGHPGSTGSVEGLVRLIETSEEGDQLESGEILVAITTNVGWTPLFPRAAAVVTDIGAPLSHAAIVARELGIPAVVGCGSATTRLRTGDRVRVDGGRGTVEIVMRSENARE
jgi:pyruvate,water dikinase